MNFKRLYCAASILALSAPAAALAQAPAPPAPSQTAASPEAAQPAASNLDTIYVTATKRAQNLQDTPVAVTAVSASQLKALNLVSISQLTEIAPSLNFVPAPSPATTMFVIRGVGTFAFNDALEQSVGLVVDGVPMARLVGSVSDAVDLSQVQVLRGPQGTIFGKNATAGVIAIDYRDPNFTQSADGRVFVGSFGERRYQGDVNLPVLSDKLAVRVAGWDFSRDGYIDAPYQPKGKIGGLNNVGARAKVLIDPTPQWTINLTSEFRQDHYDGNIQDPRGYIYSPVTGQLQNGLEVAIHNIDVAHGVVAGPDNLTSLKDTPEFTSIHQARQVVKTVYDLGFATLTGIGGYVDTYTNNYIDSDYTQSVLPIQAPGITHYFSQIRQYTGEIRLANPSSNAFKYTLGLFYYNVHVLSHQNAQTPTVTPPVASYDTLADVTTRNYAAFADASYDYKKLTVFAGFRLSDERTQGSFNRSKSADFPWDTVIGGGGPLSVNSAPINYKDFSYRAGAQYHLSSEVMLYATASKAYKGPGLNFGPSLTAAQFALNGAAVSPELARSYEGGVRSQFFDRQLTLNLTGFYSRYTNFQVTTVLPTVPTSFATVNAPLLIAQGVELEYALAPRDLLPGFRIDGSIVYNDSHYGDFQNAPCFTGQRVSPTPTTQPGICSSRGGTNVQSVSGLRAVGAPEWQVNLAANYERPVGPLRGFGQLHFLYNSDTQYGVNNNPQSIQKAYDIVDLTAGVGAPNKRWTVSLYLRNAFGQRYASRISVANPTINQSITFDALRSGGISLDVSF